MVDVERPRTARLDAPGVGDVAEVALAVTDRHGGVRLSNRAWINLLGVPHVLDDAACVLLLGAADRQRVRDALERAANDGQSQSFHLRIESNHLRRWTRWSVRPLDGTNSDEVLVSVTDVTREHSRQEDLAYRASHDSLTGLLNRHEFRMALDAAIRRQHDGGRGVAVLFVDLDNFKTVNDSAGHPTGDQVLALAAGRIRHAARRADIVARVGGDEFAVLCDYHGKDPQHIEDVAARIAAAFDRPITVDGGSWTVGVAVGTATPKGPTSTSDELLAAADRAMYSSKSRPQSRLPGSQPPPGHDQPPATVETIRTALINMEYASALIDRIFTAGLHLVAMHSLVQVHDPARIKLVAAIDELDVVMRSLRAGVFTNSLGQASSLTDGEKTTLPPSHAKATQSQRGPIRAGDQ